MRLARARIAVMLALAIAGPEVATHGWATEAVPLLSADEVQKLVDAGQYRDALKSLVRILALKPGTQGYSHFDMLMLRAECQLQLKQNAAALDSLQLAKKDADTEDDEKRQLKSTGLAELIRVSGAWKYQPKTGDAKDPIDILPDAQRKQAYQALFNDEFAVFKVKAKTAIDGKTLPPYVEAAHLAMAMRASEFGATGDTVQSKSAITDLANGALKLMKAKLKEYEADVNTISALANQTISQDVPVTNRNGSVSYARRYIRRGLNGDNVSDLKRIKSDLSKYPQAATELSSLFGVLKDEFTETGQKANSISKKADIVLGTDYSTGPDPNGR